MPFRRDRFGPEKTRSRPSRTGARYSLGAGCICFFPGCHMTLRVRSASPVGYRHRPIALIAALIQSEMASVTPPPNIAAPSIQPRPSAWSFCVRQRLFPLFPYDHSSPPAGQAVSHSGARQSQSVIKTPALRLASGLGLEQNFQPALDLADRLIEVIRHAIISWCSASAL
jgi:hypothetical protein